MFKKVLPILTIVIALMITSIPAYAQIRNVETFESGHIKNFVHIHGNYTIMSEYNNKYMVQKVSNRDSNFLLMYGNDKSKESENYVDISINKSVSQVSFLFNPFPYKVGNNTYTEWGISFVNKTATTSIYIYNYEITVVNGTNMNTTYYSQIIIEYPSISKKVYLANYTSKDGIKVWGWLMVVLNPQYGGLTISGFKGTNVGLNNVNHIFIYGFYKQNGTWMSSKYFIFGLDNIEEDLEENYNNTVPLGYLMVVILAIFLLITTAIKVYLKVRE